MVSTLCAFVYISIHEGCQFGTLNCEVAFIKFVGLLPFYETVTNMSGNILDEMECEPLQWNVSNVLVLSPHTDDMELGAGGTIHQLVASGAEVTSVVFSDCRKSIDLNKYPEDILRKECRLAAKKLGINEPIILDFPVREFPARRQEILEVIYRLARETDYDLVFTTWTGDLHQDHQTVAHETLRAFLKKSASIWAYEVPGNCPAFNPNVYISLTEDEVKQKVEMLQQYQTQVEKRGYFEINAIKAHMGYYGAQIGVPFAEAFMQERVVVKFG